ncbi:hypothetical protein [Kitasatospora sp. NPDC006786]
MSVRKTPLGAPQGVTDTTPTDGIHVPRTGAPAHVTARRTPQDGAR